MPFRAHRNPTPAGTGDECCETDVGAIIGVAVGLVLLIVVIALSIWGCTKCCCPKQPVTPAVAQPVAAVVAQPVG